MCLALALGLRKLTANLLMLIDSDAPDFIRKSRTGWRRFRSSYRQFKSFIDVNPMPSIASVSSMMMILSELRDIDVARLKVLPHVRAALPVKSCQLIASATHLIDEFDSIAIELRYAVRSILSDVQLSQTIWELTLWTLSFLKTNELPENSIKSLDFKEWSHQSISELYRKYIHSKGKSQNPTDRHRTRIHAKRLRYAIENLYPVVDFDVQDLYQTACRAQGKLGDEHDWMTTELLAEKYGHSSLSKLIRHLAC
jgi:CHAD domain-containing protein